MIREPAQQRICVYLCCAVFFEDFYKNSVIYIKDSGKHWKNDFFSDRIVFKSVYEKTAEDGEK